MCPPSVHSSSETASPESVVALSTNESMQSGYTSGSSATPSSTNFFRKPLLKPKPYKQLSIQQHQENRPVHSSSFLNTNEEGVVFQFQEDKLYGRDKEIALLREFYLVHGNRVPKNDSANILLITGPSGMGKTALAATLREPEEETHDGYFVQGKYDFATRAQPYEALTQACRQ